MSSALHMVSSVSQTDFLKNQERLKRATETKRAKQPA
jgi:hypothetical protein